MVAARSGIGNVRIIAFKRIPYHQFWRERILLKRQSDFPDFQDTSASSYEGLDQSSEGWLADCCNDAEMHFRPDDMNQSGASNVQIYITGKKSYMQTPTNLTSYVVYLFAFVKPCNVFGYVTLKVINQHILTPPSKSKQNNEDPSVYPTSAFYGKPVVGKTKIRTKEEKDASPL
ncbi:unnamed protein product [Ilex paraguariensis]|uniref:Uncharacterized protein n=1 Tax=Ilex paraguariensis TaxID=185542 RepID=A0ABC8TGV3_9AQUA